jgi:hypothetical protein
VTLKKIQSFDCNLVAQLSPIHNIHPRSCRVFPIRSPPAHSAADPYTPLPHSAPLLTSACAAPPNDEEGQGEAASGPPSPVCNNHGQIQSPPPLTSALLCLRRPSPLAFALLVLPLLPHLCSVAPLSTTHLPRSPLLVSPLPMTKKARARLPPVPRPRRASATTRSGPLPHSPMLCLRCPLLAHLFSVAPLSTTHLPRSPLLVPPLPKTKKARARPSLVPRPRRVAATTRFGPLHYSPLLCSWCLLPAHLCSMT